ncbi:hypothetical protein C5167_003261 [Papaver somniferum]|uniref:Uncharacterized protein n=1 Tax=Papaver somniferum TaxID=3469 RepID=A0A4Y7L349_PAPSO|nr:hypothetical protein C5167_003261 [Papaver somniferum]
MMLVRKGETDVKEIGVWKMKLLVDSGTGVVKMKINIIVKKEPSGVFMAELKDIELKLSLMVLRRRFQGSNLEVHDESFKGVVAG